MHTRVSIPHHDYPASLRNEVEQKLLALDRFADNIVTMSATIERQKTDHRVEVVANVGHGNTLVADVHRDAFGAALEEALERMTSQLKKHQEKIVDARHGRR